MLIGQKRKGMALVEAMLAITLIAGTMAYRAKIEASYHKTEVSREFASDIADIIYGMDKRLLLDGNDLTSPAVSVSGRVASYKQIIKELVGVDNPSCSGGWRPRDVINKSVALVNCHTLNPHKLPFSFDMDFSMKSRSESGSPHGVMTSMDIDFYHATNNLFEKNFSAYIKVPEYLKVLDTPQITGSHRYYLIDRASKQEITIGKCRALKTGCAIRASLVTNLGGLSESPYLRINGDNFMISDLKFQDQSAPRTYLKCKKADGAVVPCGLDYNPTENKVTSVNNGGFILTSSGAAIKCKDKDNRDVNCGIIPLNNKAALMADKVISEDIFFGRALGSKNGAFSVDNGGHLKTTDIKTNSVSDIQGRSKQSYYSNRIEANTDLFKVNANNFHVKTGAGVAVFEGKNIRKSGGSDKAGVRPVKEEYATKEYLSSLPQTLAIIQGARTWQPQVVQNYCMNSVTPRAFFVPDKVVGRSLALDQEVCPYNWGNRVANWGLELHSQNVSFKVAGNTVNLKMLGGATLTGTKSCDTSMNGWQDTVVWSQPIGTQFKVEPRVTYYNSKPSHAGSQRVNTTGTLYIYCPPVR